MNKKITLSMALMLMLSSQVNATTSSGLLSADSTGAGITMPDMTTISPDMATIANNYITTMPTTGNSQFTQQMPNSSMAFTVTGPTISPTSSLADSGIDTSALYENMAMAQNVGATHNTAFNLMSGNTYDATSTVDSSTDTSTMTDSSTNTYTNSANTASTSGSGTSTNDSEDPTTNTTETTNTTNTTDTTDTTVDTSVDTTVGL